MVSFNPRNYHQISDESLKRMVWHVPLVVLAGFLIWLVLLAPTLFTFVDGVESQLQTFSVLEMDGSIEMAEPISLPTNDPEIVIDTTEERLIGGETIRVTRKFIYFNLIGKAQRVPVNKILNPLDYKEEFGQFLLMGMLFVLPSLLFYLYVGFLIKYALIIGLTALLSLFVIHVLLIIDISPRRIINLAVYSATPMILLETLISPFASKYLLPIWSLLSITFYAIPLGLYLGLFITGLVFLQQHAKHEDAGWRF